jgi:hypothetical protein
VGLTDYRKFEAVKSAILAFREKKESHIGQYNLRIEPDKHQLLRWKNADNTA